MAKTKLRHATNRGYKVDDDEQIPVVALPLDPVVPVRRRDTGMVLDVEGLGNEVASALKVNGVRAYLSVVNKGVSLVASNRAHTAFIPVRIEACKSGLDVRRDEAKPLVKARGVLAFILDGRSYYVPVSEYLEMAEDRGESGMRLDVDEHAKWLEKYKGHAGVKRVFAKLLT
jgi:hypothetical protein